MKVRAIAPGQYANQFMDRGRVFDITDEKHFSKRWMVLVYEPKPQERRMPENQDDRNAINEQLEAEKLEAK